MKYSRKWFEANICSIPGVKSIRINSAHFSNVLIDVILNGTADAENVATEIERRVESDVLFKITMTLLQPHPVKVITKGI